MKAKERRNEILNILKSASSPVSASALANQLSVSRQVIVGDIALHRASGIKIAATPRGYIIEEDSADEFPFTGLVATKHTADQARDELYTMVDYGGYVINVIIEHPIYGQIVGPLDIASRHDADLFTNSLISNSEAKPLSTLTGGVHYHKIGCRSEETFELIKDALDNKGFLYTD
jgi:transcriptional regulator of NAD metabolism